MSGFINLHTTNTGCLKKCASVTCAIIYTLIHFYFFIFSSYMIDKLNDTKEYLLNAAFVMEIFSFKFNITFIKMARIPIPLCNGNFKLPGKFVITSSIL